MKYTRLTTEQFNELHQEFINFLASQSITGEEWNRIKKEQPELAEQELDVFSDLIWEGVLNKSEYLENKSPQQFFLFHLGETHIKLIAVKITDNSIDLNTTEGAKWLSENIQKPSVELFTSEKEYSADRNIDVFELIKQGAVISEGELYNWISELL